MHILVKLEIYFCFDRHHAVIITVAREVQRGHQAVTIKQAHSQLFLRGTRVHANQARVRHCQRISGNLHVNTWSTKTDWAGFHTCKRAAISMHFHSLCPLRLGTSTVACIFPAKTILNHRSASHLNTSTLNNVLCHKPQTLTRLF